ncbi:FRG domain-containing protein [Lysinibacillus pakistanensis]|uniref:FRG domain-containing protein n=1 Tax=Lysinibacillus pakistanensis TaxID=759811 RepID=A0AAX3WS42_9BACI|nr:FRG domain-containing protein [Lysinibacillus pakistanensis]MDM5233713.1 FRG domain-containing protein [Lysinibacillus pakistanensis]WHY44338.1 FRG domain-containing protein [Lysinibacillus pakistanensis]WHY49345.1 FRG domain-containing protein [Lysinibacillus pakistanensis]
MEQINSILDYQKALEWYEQYFEKYFRGQAALYPSIKSSIARDDEYLINEYNINQEAIKLAEMDFSKCNSPLEKLAKMQHYGIPTRLVDVTTDPLVALFFAVTDTKNGDDGYVYMFVKKSKESTSKEVKLLSILAFSPDYNISTLQRAYAENYGETIEEYEIFKYISSTPFIKQEGHWENERLKRQQGTFAICGNTIQSRRVNRHLLNLDSYKPTMTFRIPFEKKESIKAELDEIGYNLTWMYPDLPSVAQYLKEKYSVSNRDLTKAFIIKKTEESNVYGGKVRRISIYIALTEKVSSREIKKIGSIIKENNEHLADVIFLYVARNEKDFLSDNYLIRGQWVSPALPEKMSPTKWAEADLTGYQWVENTGYAVYGDFFDKHLFNSDKEVYVKTIILFNKVQSLSEKLLSVCDDIEKMRKFAIQNQSKVREIFLQSGDIGITEKEFINEFITKPKEVISTLDNIFIYLLREDYKEQQIQYRIQRNLSEIKSITDKINEEYLHIEKLLNISQDDFERYTMEKIEEKFCYTETLPICSDALDVEINVSILKNEQGYVKVMGKTNLFDGASLLIGFSKGSDRTTVCKGKFESNFFSDKGQGFTPGKYECNITLSIPRTQSKEFVSKTGIEYERLKGPLVKREGIGPTISYSKIITLN